METDLEQPIQMCTLCYKQVHYVCLHNDEQAASIPVCRACASVSDSDRTELKAAGAPCPPDEPREEEIGENFLHWKYPRWMPRGLFHVLIMEWIT